MRRQSDRRLLCRPGDLVPNVPCVHHRPAGRADGHQVSVFERHGLRSGDARVRARRRGGLHAVGALLLSEPGAVRQHDGSYIGG